jgi:glycosyltransferase involved in cell wall biosynthesis
MQKEKKRLLFLSDSPLTCTGYGIISTQISNRMVDKGWDVHVMGHNYIGQNLPPGLKFEDGTKLKFKVSGAGMEPYCKDLIPHRLMEDKPDVFMILLDTFMMYPWLLDMDLSPGRSVFYFPSDGGGQLPTGCENILKKVNYPVSMSKFGQKQAIELHGVNNCLYIPHAVDHNIYYPLKDDELVELRKKWGLTNKFVIGTVARNQGRKMLDRTIKAFAEFCKDKPDAILLMHTDPTDRAAVFDLNNLIFRYNIQNRVIFSGMKYYKGFDYTQMNEVYNLMDVFLLTTSGEGWGIPTTEAMSCEVPVCVTDYTTTQEIVTDNNCGEAVKLSGEITGSWNVERGVMDIEDCASKLTKLYNESKLRKKYGKNGRKAILKHYSWDVVAKQWYDLLEKITNE